MKIHRREPDDLAKKEYVADICRVLRSDFAKERARLHGGSYVFSVQDKEKFKRERSFNIDLEGLPEAREQDQIVVRLVGSDSESIVAKGFIGSIRKQKVKIILDNRPKFDDKTTDESKFEIQFDIARIDEQESRIKTAIESFKLARKSSHVMNCLLNHYEERTNTKYIKTRVLNLVDSPKLSKKQSLAVEQSLMKRISLIEGVAGSGKTLVAANIAYSMSRIHEQRRKVLLCSPLQSTVNQLVKILSSEPGISVVQLTPTLVSDRWDRSFNSKLCLRESAKELVKNRWIERVSQGSRSMTTGIHYVSEFQIKKTEQALLKDADIVCCTLEQSLDECLRNIDFKVVIIDDAQYAKEYECLLALRYKNIKQVTLIGDMRRTEQLVSHSMKSSRNRSLDRRIKNRYDRRYSFIADSRIRRSLASSNGTKSRDAIRTDQEVGSLFDRWLARGLPSVVLKLRFRKINKLDAFLRLYFYPFETTHLTVDRKLSSEQRIPLNGDIAWPPKTPILLDIDNEPLECIVSKLKSDIARWDPAASICIMTNYDPETKNIGRCNSNEDRGSVNDFLGQQRDYVILVCENKSETRLDQKNRVNNDFLLHDEALMIALTRACRCLFVIIDLKKTTPTESSLPKMNNAASVEPQSIGNGWKSFVQYCQEENMVLRDIPQRPTTSKDNEQ